MTEFNLSKGNYRIKLSLNGEYQLVAGDFKLKKCRPRLFCDGQEYPLTAWQMKSWDDDEIFLETENEVGVWFMEFNNCVKEGISLRLYGELNTLSKNVRLVVMDLPKLEARHLLGQGISMGLCTSRLLGNCSPQDFEAFYQLMISRQSGSLQLSFPLRQRQPNSFTGITEFGRISKLQASSVVHNFGEKVIAADALTLKYAADGFVLMTDYADVNLEKPKDFSATFPAGWNSWDDYRWTISEEEVLKNAEFIASDPILSKHIKRIIVDDGWQYCYGEWEPNHYFPNGMEYLAKELTKMGFEPGLWFAPTIVEPHARIAQLDYDILARGESGNPCLGYECMGRKGFLLDPTQGKVQQHLGSLFSRYADMGYKYFKLDFMGQTLNARKFANVSTPRSEIPRLIVKSIYEAVHDRAIILGCNYQFRGGTDFVDAVRAGGDIHARWDCIQRNSMSVGARFWSNKRLWVNDPDFALCRALDTSKDPFLNRLQPVWVSVSPDNPDPQAGVFSQVDIRKAQTEILLSIVLASGGTVNFSDKMYLLNAEGLDLARRTAAAEVGETAIPLDLFESELPCRWLQKVGNKYRLLLINWQDSSCEEVFDLRRQGIDAKQAVNFWNDQNVKIINGEIIATLEARSCLFVVLS
ncbi:MAG: alpha-galactosidase [Victivallaceae bacterium]|nr:alpha-galactosidase [Victivallaceae bacterium]MDD4180288.1 alpha-galactosidase [Victivallaceae bacterium]